ncbi:hypothetical protein JAAARDRAFT_196385 [Jaapia argillacea MUCL 33604]|uniref:Uncharacterized protein n=1 Tax=Jaapia argillacea MUCL 33604 TaxID=933084 RepID=A0A067PHV2_9AGAM|nr:hypothetical protein JAAARDRAFT_196385 [Jaapia argillacea MUCL 33604]
MERERKLLKKDEELMKTSGALKRKNAELLANNNILVEANAELEGQHADYEAEIGRVNELATHTFRPRRRWTERRRRKAVNGKITADIQDLNDEISRIRAENATLHEQAAKETELLRETAAAKGKLEEMVRDNKPFRRRNIALVGELEAGKREIEALSTKNDDEQGILKALREREEVYVKRQEELQLDNAILKGKVGELEGVVQGLLSEVASYHLILEIRSRVLGDEIARGNVLLGENECLEEVIHAPSRKSSSSGSFSRLSSVFKSPPKVYSGSIGVKKDSPVITNRASSEKRTSSALESRSSEIHIYTNTKGRFSSVKRFGESRKPNTS